MSEKLISVNEVLKYTVLAGEIRNQYMEVVPAYFVREAPAVDAVEVVRCKDCMMFCPQSDPIAQHCFVTGNVVSDDDFCSFGERREENEVD